MFQQKRGRGNDGGEEQQNRHEIPKQAGVWALVASPAICEQAEQPATEPGRGKTTDNAARQAEGHFDPPLDILVEDYQTGGDKKQNRRPGQPTEM
ncbi:MULTISPECIES: hypothetical protein [Mameliella]|uniref:hypothetical protein n=1 Tax=Mameliella TaxID=1434019 RepID=UPI001CC0C5A6|nr:MULTISPECIES: hypothetical protein [Mameliella]